MVSSFTLNFFKSGRKHSYGIELCNARNSGPKFYFRFESELTLFLGTSKVGWGSLSNPGLLNFGDWDSVGTAGYSPQHWVGFIILGILGGLFGALFNAINSRVPFPTIRKTFGKISRFKNK
jgi:hypothetical protein